MPVQEIVTAVGQKRYLVVDAAGNVVVSVTRYLKFLDHAGRARNTIRTYAYSLSLFAEFLQQQSLTYQQLTLDDLAKFVVWLKMPHASLTIVTLQPAAHARTNTTINHILTTVAGFYDYLWRQDDLEHALHTNTHTGVAIGFRPFKGFFHHLIKEHTGERHLLRQPTAKGRPPTLSHAEVSLLVAGCQNRRDHLLLMLLFESSLRIGEALALWIEDIDVGRCRLRVQDRGALANDAEIKTPASCRSVDVSRDLINLILDYLAIVHTDDVATNHLFIKLRGAHAGDPLEYADVHDLFQRLQRKTGIDATPHLLRHSSLTALARAGWRPEHLQQRAGHANFQYTYQLYVHSNDEDLRDAWEMSEHHLHLSQGGKA